jgi:photosystem II stability/assembly factor-like uncharacterized protein
MNKIFTIAFLLIVSSTLAQEGWTTLTAPTATRYDDIFFVNDQIGWTAGGWLMKVHKTTNGGKTWMERGTFTKYLRSIEFMDSNIGLCGSLDGSLYRTTNGGASWIDVAPNIDPQPAGVCGLAKADENTIYGVGIWSEPAFVIKSVDKGLTWTYTDMSAHASSLIDVHFLDADHGFVTGSVIDEEDGEVGVVLYTDDGGQTWTEKFRTNHVSDRIWKIQTPDNKHFFGSIESLVEGDGEPTRFIRSSDSGQTWEMLNVHSNFYNIQAIGFIDSLHGWTGGRSTLFETKNGGDTWEQVPVGSAFNRFFKVSENVAYLTGSKIYKFDRTVTPDPDPTPDPVTGTPDLDPYDPIHYIRVSPNPTTGKVNVHVNFGNSTRAHIYLYSTHGKNLKRIFDGNAEAGERTFAIDISNQPPQTFIVILKTNEGMESVKVVKQ